MKTSTNFGFRWIIMVGMAISMSLIMGCSERDISPLQKSEFRLAVLDERLDRVTVLEEGMDFYIGIELVNNSKDTLSFSYGNSIQLLTHFIGREDFLMIYRADATGLAPVGRPYNPEIALNFVTANVSPIKIPPLERSDFLLGFSWASNSENHPLDQGNYYSSFKDKVVVENVEMDIDTEIQFEIR